MDSVYLQFCDFHSFFIIFVFYNEFNPLEQMKWPQNLWVRSHGSVSPQLSDGAIWAIPGKEEASVQQHQLPEAVYLLDTTAALGKRW